MTVKVLNSYDWENQEGCLLYTSDFSMKNLIPHFDWKYFSSLSILVFAVGGCEKISPYVNKVEDPAKGFPKSMILSLIHI